MEGGPNYEILLTGDSSAQDFRLSTSHIDVGDVRFNEWSSKDFYLENTSKVTFAFKVLTDQIVRKGLVEVSP